MASSDYIPAKDADFQNWFLNLATLATAAPTTYGLTVPQAAAIQARYDVWEPAYTLAVDPGTRTPATVAAKDAARAAAEETIRPLCVMVSQNAAVTNEDKTALGVTVRKLVPTPVPAPVNRPALALIAALPGQQQIRYWDAENPVGKSKPAGSIGVELWVAVGVAAAVDPSQASYRSTNTKSPLVLTTDPADRGKFFTVFARFVTRSGPAGVAQTGPWSLPLVSTVV